jgi:hypothetical protein
MKVTRPAHYTFLVVPLGQSWYAEIEVSGRLFAAMGPSMRACAETLREKAAAAGLA